MRALAGRRRCREGWDIVLFLYGVMRSMIRDHHRDEAEGRVPVLRDDLDIAAYDDSLSAFEQMAHDAIDYRRTSASVRQALRSDAQLTALLDAILDGRRGEDLQRQVGVDANGLAALRRRLNRKLATQRKSLS